MHSTPQQNGLVDIEFATIAACARAMCSAAHLGDQTHFGGKQGTYISAALGNLVIWIKIQQ